MMNRSRTPLWSLLLAVLLMTGCTNLGYYVQAASGHHEVMHAAVPISELIRDPGSDPDLKRKLADVQAIRDFASRELGLPDNDSYRAYADLGRPYVLWNVFAAPAFSLDAKRWCLLMVGCVSYRGYYGREDAESLAAELRQQGYDTFVGGVPAYSTLGYFKDPVLNTFLRLGTFEVARTVFHELAHQLIFVPGDTQFNESFASTVETEGMRRWLARHATPEQRAAFETQRLRKAAFTDLLRDHCRKFRALYESPRSPAEQHPAKAALLADLRRGYADLKAGWGGYSGYDPFFGDDLNNAKLASLSLYNEWIPAFEALLAEQDHDLPRFYRRVEELAALDPNNRYQALAQLLPVSPGSSPSFASTAAGAAEDALQLASTTAGSLSRLPGGRD
ncbi:MAG: aminopeptidase [Candidatus Accumulibacter sp. UW26]|jgi:predicted aminopeptidase